MSPEQFSNALRRLRILAILRGVPPEHSAAMTNALYAGGIRLLEFSLSTPNALEALRIGRAQNLPGLFIGAGTVLSRADAQLAQSAGATFLVTPHAAPEVLTYGLEQDIAVLCGAMTPTEIAIARTTGNAVKLFPADALGAGYVRSLKGPYPDIELLVVGGISVDNLATYLSAGALGAGIGGALTDVDWSKPDWAKTTRIAADLMEIAREFAA